MAITSLEKSDDGQARFPGCSNIRDYEFVGKLGEGTFGEVYRARSKKDTTVVALKKILMHHEKEGFPITAIREIKLLKALSHPNILQLKEMAIERGKGDGRKKPSMYMVFPYMEHDLSGLLENPAVQFTEPQIKCYLMQLLGGLKYLHASRILHRDMKAANLLISNGGLLQIADFGLARPYDEPPPQPGKGGGEAKREYTALVVTRWYRPPELLLQLKRYTTAIDLWGVGCVFGEMFKGKPILMGNSDLNQAQLIFSLVGTPTEENMPGWSLLPGCEGVKNFGFKRGNLADYFKDILTLPLLRFQHDPEISLNSQIRMNLIGRSFAVSEHQYLLFLPSIQAIPSQTVAGEALALADQIPEIVAFLVVYEAGQMDRVKETPIAAGLSLLRKETPGYLRVPQYPLTRHGMGPKPTDLTEEKISGEIDMARAVQEPDRATLIPMFLNMATLLIVHRTLAPILTGVQTIDTITVGSQEGEVVVPVTGMGVAADHPTGPIYVF
ncbi:Serine/threonine-protein kinase bur1 [Penicillium nucicola]|uniref:Serine/threonine-protein kinase bur1 n=1 Tax=Penicillium nucicola TaxID=1850975 RepID=UPI0025459E66|nr:Serine/threonine-protein kinase bur1 [Penicillium nucicola]KAJ5757045.1 Serine/threonine-protein kinase bur1 [Penicillium nucicola]